MREAIIQEIVQLEIEKVTLLEEGQKIEIVERPSFILNISHIKRKLSVHKRGAEGLDPDPLLKESFQGRASFFSLNLLTFSDQKPLWDPGMIKIID